LKIKIEINYNNEKIANSIAKALLPDDKCAPPHLKIRTWNEGGKLNSRIECENRFDTFMSTINDLLASIQAAEKSIETIKSGINNER
jgi:hypothetical protein